MSKFFKDENLPFLEARFVLNSSNHYDKHFHDTFSIGCIEDGNVSFLCQNKTYDIKQNTLVVINPNVVHACNPVENEARTYHMVYLDTQWCKGLQEIIFGKLDRFIEIPSISLEDKELCDKFIKLNYILLDQEVFYLEKEELLQEFLIVLFTKYSKLKPVNYKEKDKGTDIVKKAQEYIKENLNTNLTVKQISGYLGISEFYLIKLFKQTTHITPHAFLLNQKIILAKELLTKDADISQIAYQLGFSDQSHLNKIFKKLVGTTPNSYKKDMVN